MFKLLIDIASIRVATVHTESIILTIVIQFPLDLLTKDHHSKDLINLKRKSTKTSMQIIPCRSHTYFLALPSFPWDKNPGTQSHPPPLTHEATQVMIWKRQEHFNIQNFKISHEWMTCSTLHENIVCCHGKDPGVSWQNEHQF